MTGISPGLAFEKIGSNLNRPLRLPVCRRHPYFQPVARRKCTQLASKCKNYFSYFGYFSYFSYFSYFRYMYTCEAAK